MRIFALLLLMAVPGWAEAPADTTIAPATGTEPVECQSCTSRHKALKKLQDARLTPPAPTASDDQGTAPESTDE